MKVLGVDIGGSGVKGAIVDTRTGNLLTDRCRLKTPNPATPKMVSGTVRNMAAHFTWKGPIGCGMPGPFKAGRMMLSNNLHKSWIGVKASEVFARSTGCPVTVLNDADAAGCAEMAFGAGRGERGVVILVTLGTGIGSAVFIDGHLVPNTELGQMELDGKRAELRASAKVRKDKNLTWAGWGKRLQAYFDMVELLFWPDLIIIGGGVSRRADRFLPLLKVRARIVPARFRNEAGIIGAALSAASKGARR